MAAGRGLWLAAIDVPPQLGSGIAAKQYDPGAPFFVTMSYELLAISYWHQPGYM